MRVAIPRGCVLWTSGLQTHCADIKWRTSGALFGHLYVRSWHKPAVRVWAEHVRSARVFQTSTCSAIARASSTSMPRYLTRAFDLGVAEQKLDSP